MGIVVFCFGAVQPLADPDLPMHPAVISASHWQPVIKGPLLWCPREAIPDGRQGPGPKNSDGSVT